MSHYFIFVTVLLFQSGAIDQLKELATRNSFGNACCRKALFVTRLPLGQKFRRSYGLSVTMVVSIERDSCSFCLTLQIMFESIIIHLCSSFAAKWVFMSVLWLFTFVETKLEDTSWYCTMETGVVSRRLIFSSSSRMLRICSLTKALPGSTSMATFSTTVDWTFVSESPTLICNVTLPLVLDRSCDENKSGISTSSNSFDIQSLNKKSFEIISGCFSVLRKKVTQWIILFFGADWNGREVCLRSCNSRNWVFIF